MTSGIIDIIDIYIDIATYLHTAAVPGVGGGELQQLCRRLRHG